jgi:D-3-phosphoglycerate dehydrogenase
MAKYRVVITDYEYESLSIERDVLQALDVEFITAQCRTEEEVIEAAQYADGILNQYAPITSHVVDRLKQCKVISRYGVGVNTVDLNAATRRGIVVANCTDYCLDEVADHAMALLLGAARKVSLLNGHTKSGLWDYKKAVPVHRLRGKVLGLAGFGKIAQNLSLKAKAFGMRVITYDPYISEALAAGFEVEIVEFPALCAASDYLSVHLPLNEATKGLIGSEQFRLMKPECVLINTSRGPVIDEPALVEALRTSQIAGACLDVVEQEPLAPNHPFLTMEQVTLTPHVAWYSEESERELKRKVTQNIVDVLSGFFPDYIANPQVKSQLALKQKSLRQGV